MHGVNLTYNPVSEFCTCDSIWNITKFAPKQILVKYPMRDSSNIMQSGYLHMICTSHLN